MFSTQKLQGKRHAIIKFKWLGLMNSLKKGPLVENCPAIFVFRSERERVSPLVFLLRFSQRRIVIFRAVGLYLLVWT